LSATPFLIDVSNTSVARRLLGEDDRRDPRPEEPNRELRRLAQVGCADAEVGVHDRRVVADERLVARRRATLGDLLHVLPHEPPGSSPGLAMVAEAMMNCGAEP